MSKSKKSKGMPIIDLGISKKTNNTKVSVKKNQVEVDTSFNLKKTPSSETANLNFKVKPDFKREFKMTAIENDMTQMELLYKLYDFWINSRNK